MPRAVILTALPVEYMAVRTHLTDLQEEMHSQGTIYERGKFIANGQEWEVGIVEVGAGNAGTVVEAERAIAYFKPNILLFVGIAGGIKDVAIGDVVAATDVYGYESGKVGDNQQFFVRPKVGKSAYALEQRARAEARNGEWVQRLLSLPSRQPRVFVAPIAVGEKVVASKQSELFQFLRDSYNDAVAVDMESFGFLSAVFAYPEIKAIVIRGISGFIGVKNDEWIELGETRQKTASRHSSAFAFEMLSKLKIISQYSHEFPHDIPRMSEMAPSQQLQQIQQNFKRIQDELQAELNIKNEKLKQLEQALAIESNTNIALQLRIEIKNEKRLIENIEDKLIFLNKIWNL